MVSIGGDIMIEFLAVVGFAFVGLVVTVFLALVVLGWLACIPIGLLALFGMFLKFVTWAKTVDVLALAKIVRGGR